MRFRLVLLPAAVALFLFSGCTPSYRLPYLSLDLKSVYSTADVKINYTYVCEEDDQHCVYKLYNKVEPSVEAGGGDGVLPQSGSIEFNGLQEGDYSLEFSVYSFKNETYSLLKFLDESYDFSVDFP